MILAVACNPGPDPDTASTIRGEITDGSGTQARYAGSGTVAAATDVRAMATGADAKGEIVGEAQVEADGSYALLVPAETEKLVVQALDSDGSVVGSVIVEQSGAAGDEVRAQPVDVETSVEAEVFLEMLDEVEADAIDTIDLRKRIFVDTATQLRVGADSGQNGQIEALAEAGLAAQAVRESVFAEFGSAVDASELWAAKKLAAEVMVANVTAGSESPESTTVFLQDGLEAEAGLGIEPAVAASAEHQASLAWRGVLEASLGERVDSEALLDAGVRSSGIVEAFAMENHVRLLADDPAFAGGAGAQMDLAFDDLMAETRTSASVNTTTAAFATFSDALLAGDDAPLVSLTLDLPLTLELDVLVGDVLDAEASLETGIDTELGALYADGDAEADVVADTVLDGWTDYESEVETAVAASGVIARPDLAVQLMTEATGSFMVQ